MKPYARNSLLLGGRSQYSDKVLATDPIAYWLLDEKQGTVAYGSVAVAQNGAHTGVTLGQPGIGDGRTSPLYDGALDYTNILTAALSAALNGSEGTVVTWARVSGAGVWTDAALRRTVRLRVDGNNEIYMRKNNANDRLDWVYIAGGVTLVRSRTPENTLQWMYLALTWSAAADEVRAYFQGIQEGATINGLGVWGAGALSIATIGAGALPGQVWDGYVAHCAVWDRPLSPAQIADLAVIE